MGCPGGMGGGRECWQAGRQECGVTAVTPYPSDWFKFVARNCPFPNFSHKTKENWARIPIWELFILKNPELHSFYDIYFYMPAFIDLKYLYNPCLLVPVHFHYSNKKENMSTTHGNNFFES